MKHGIGRKLLSVVLAVMMLVSLLPTAAFADDSAEPIVVNSVVGDSNTGNDTKLADEALVNVGDTNANEGEGEETTTPVSTPVAKIGNTGYATLDAAITAVQNGETIEVNAGEYTLNGSLNYTGKAFTIAAADGADVSFDMSAAVALHGAKITFNNVTFNYKTNGNYIGLQHTDTLVYNKCTINGMVFLYAVNETFNNCTFNQTSAGAYNVWTYGAQNVAFNGCTFNCVGRCVLVYNEGAIDKTDLTVENTKFNASAPAEGKAAIEIDTSLMAGGATITVDEQTTAKGFDNGSNSGKTLWNDKKQTADTNKNTTVTVAGVAVFEPVATAAVAKIGETEYETLAAAIEAAKDGDTVKLLADATEDVVINKNITLDLGGKTLTNTGAGKATVTIAKDATATVQNGSIIGGTSYYNIQNNGTATFKDVTATAGNTGSSMIDNFGTLTINSGTYTGGLDTIKNEPNATLTITDGTFELTKGNSDGFTGVVFNYGDLTITGGTFTQSDKNAPYGQAQVIHTDKSGSSVPSTVIKGGTFKNLCTKDTAFVVRATNAAAGATKVSGGTFNKKVSESYWAEGYGVYETAKGEFTAMSSADKVARLGSYKYYTSLEEAIAAVGTDVSTSTVVYLLKNVTINEQLVIDNSKAITLDLNGFTLTSTYAIGKNGSYALVNKTPLTIKNGTFAAGEARAIGAYGKLTLTKATVTQKLTGGHACVAFCANDTKYWITNSKIDGAYAVCSFANNATISITGSTLNGTGNTLYHNGSNYGLKLTVKNTTITSTGGCGVYISGSTSAQSNEANQNGVGGYQKATFTGCTISGTNGVEVKYTDLTLNGCTVKATVETPSYKQDNNGPAGEGFAVVSTDNAMNNVTPKPEGTITITGDGKYTGPVGLGSLASVKTEYPDFKDETIAISGGTFSSAVPAEYCAAGFIPTANADGTYGVKEGTYVAETNGVKYESLAEAITAAKSGATVTLLADTRENVTIAKAMTLDLNGCTLNGGTEKGKPALTVTARVTVKDSSTAQTGTIMRDDTAENSGVSSHYVIDIQGNSQGRGWLTFESGTVKNNSGNKEGKGASLVRVGDDSVKKYPGLVINGGTFTQDNFIVIKVDRGYLNLNGGTLKSANSYAVENWFNANIKGGTVNGAVSSWTYSGGSNSTLTISGGTVNEDVTSVNYGDADKVAKVEITGGTVNGKLDTRSYDPKTGELTSIVDAAKATIKVSGGTFNNAVETRYCDEGYTPVQISDGKYGVQQQQVLAKIGDTAYYTMDEAFHAVREGETIVMQRDYTTGTEQSSGNKSFAIDLNGKTWTYTGTNTNHAAFEINHSDVTLTVKNGTVVSNSMVGLIPSAMGVGSTITYDNAGLVFEGVTMTANGHSGIETNGNNTNDTVTLKNSTLDVPNGFGIYFPSSGTLTIDNSKINAKTMGVQVCAGSLSISGDQTAITVSGDAVPKTENDGAIQDGAAISIVNRGYKPFGEIAITGGTFESKVAAIKAYDWDNTNKSEKTFTANDKVAVSGGTFTSAVKEEYCATGYIPTTNSDGTYGVKEGQYVAYVGNNSTNKFETLQAAIDAAKDNQTVRLLADITLTETAVFPEGKKVSINLQGHKITATGTALRINGTTDINSSKTGAPDAAQTGMIESTNNVAVAVGNNAKLSVFSGTLKGREGAVITGTSTGATIDVRGSKATLIATDNAVIAGNGSKRDGDPNNITIRNGTFIGSITTKGYIACGIYAPWNDNVTVIGGTFNITNGAGIVARAGTVKVTGGTFNCGDGTVKGWVGDSKNNVPNAALVFDKAANYPALTESSQILVSGGTFSTDPAANGATLATGYVATPDENGMYKVAKSNPVAEINGDKYDTLSQAIAALEDKGGTIKLLQDINAPSMNYRITENITIDLNGHNITGNGAEGVFYVYTSGHLTITGDGVITAVENNKAAIAVQVYSEKAKVTLEGGTYKQQITNINDPHFDLIYVYYGTAEIKGGTYQGATPDWTLNCKDENYQSKEAKIEVTGGTFVGFDPANNTAEGEGTNFVPAGYVSTKGADGKFVVTEVKVAEVNGKQYGTLSEAIAAANAGDTVKLIANFSTDATKTTATDRLIVDKSITLDLNGYTMTIPGELESSSNWAAFYINGGTLTVKDSTKSTGAIIGADKTKENPEYRGGVYLFHLSGGNLVIENGTFYAGGTVVNVENGTATVNGGKFSVYPDVGTKDSRYLLNCIDNSYKAGTAHITVTGGTFTGFDPANNKAEGENTNFVAAGYKSVDNNDGTYTVVKNENVVAVIGTKEYATLSKALKAAQPGDTVVLVADADEADNFVQISANITLDLAGHSVTALYFYVTGTVKDTAAATDRGIVKAKMYAMFDNAYTPVYDSAKDGYSFFDLSVQTMWQSATSQYIFALKWTTEGQEALKLMLANDKTRRVQAQVTFSWVGKTGPGGQFFTFNDKTMSDYLTDGYRVALRATAQGLTELQQSVGQIEVQAKFVILDANGYELYTLLSDPTEIK